MLGPVFVFRGVPSGNVEPERLVVRVHSWLAGILFRSVLRTHRAHAGILQREHLVQGGKFVSAHKPIKLIPRNVAALRRGQQQSGDVRQVPGNPASTRLVGQPTSRNGHLQLRLK